LIAVFPGEVLSIILAHVLFISSGGPTVKSITILACAVAVLALAPLRARTNAASSPAGYLAVANQGDHTALLIDLSSDQTLARVEVGVNGHELAVSHDGHFAYVPIYGNSGVGKPGTDGTSIDIVDLRTHKLAGHIDLGKPLRPHRAAFGPDGLLYVSAELADSLYAIDVNTRKIVAQIPTGAPESHMFVISPDGKRAYTANVGVGSVSVLDLEKRSLVTVIPVAKTVQRISISPDGRFVFTHDQHSPRIAVIDTASNKIADWIQLPASVYSSAPTPNGRWLLANAPSGKLFAIAMDTRKVVGTFDIPKAVGEIAINANGSKAYISCPQAGTIEVFDLTNNKLEDPIKLTPGVDGLAWFPTLP
jgi:YVTN family beta-propeller protein